MVSRGGDRERDPMVRPVAFALGQLLMTPGVQSGVPPSEMAQALRRHARGDWGDLDDEDRKSNDEALKSGARLLSSYKTRSGTTFWIITEADRSSTTVLLPGEY